MAEASTHEELRLLTPAQTAALLAVSKRTLWRMLAEGLMPAPVKLGGRVTRFRLSDIRAMIEEGSAR